MKHVFLALVLSVVALAAAAETRVALVIGNAAYENAPRLPNPGNDAAAIAARLEAVGFEVTLGLDMGHRDFNRAVGAFARKATQADISLVYYAGHGIELSGDNYLIPTDAIMDHEATAGFESVSLDTLVESAGLSRQLSIVMIDACRDNPFVSTIQRLDPSRSMSRGLAPMSARGQVVSFATAPGRTAADGDGDHSPYAEALLALLDEPGVEISFFFRRLRDAVREKTDGKQTPIIESDLPSREIHLVPPVAQDIQAALPASPPQARSPEGNENEFFRSAFRTAVDEITECDRKAGYDWHPRVEGGHIAYEDIDPDAALAACERAILEYPEEWFFYFLAARALDAGNNQDPRIRRYVELGGRADPAFAYDRLGRMAEYGFGGFKADVALAAEYYDKARAAGSETAVIHLASLYADATPADYDKALVYYDQAIAEGLTTAALSAGNLHLQRKLPNASDAEALRYFSLGCRQGHMPACGDVGFMHAKGRAPRSDVATAVDYLTRACDADEGFACRELGHVFKDRRVEGKGDADAYALFVKACELGDANGCGHQGRMHFNGRVPEPNIQVALDKLGGACAEGEVWACRELAYVHERGEFDGASDAEAVRLFAAACAAGSADGCHMEGFMHKQRRVPEPDLGFALTRLQDGCETGAAWACANVGDYHEDGLGGTRDYPAAAAAFSEGCTLGDALSCGRLADLHDDGVLGERDPVAALDKFARGCELGNAWSCSRAGSLHDAGEGTTPDPARAADLYRRGCDGGNARGCGRLAGLHRDGRGVTRDLVQAYRLATQSCEGEQGYYCGYAAMMIETKDVAEDMATGLTLRKQACALGHAESCGVLGWGPYVDLGDGPSAADYLVMSLEGKARFVWNNLGYFDRDLSRDLQRALRDRGYYSGAIDGVLGEGSQRAMKSAYDS